MKRILPFAVLTLFASPLLISGEGRGTKIAFSVKSGTTITKTYETETELTLDGFDMTMNGQEPPMVPGMDMTVTGVTTTEVEGWAYFTFGCQPSAKTEPALHSLRL